MSLATNLQSAFTRVGTEFKAIRTLIGGSGTANISGLATTDKSSLVAAINEVQAGGGGGGATSLDGLSDVVITTPANDHIIRHNGTNFVNVAGSTIYQPIDADLTSIAALTTTAYGRAFLALVNQAGLMGLLSSASETAQGIVELATVAEATTGTDSTRAVTAAGVAAVRASLKTEILGAGVPAALDTLDELAAALGDDANFAASVTTNLAGKQPLDADLTSIAAVTSAANKMLYATGAGTWTVTDLSAFARTLLDDADAATMRATLSTYSQAEIGDPTTDFTATFVAALA